MQHFFITLCNCDQLQHQRKHLVITWSLQEIKQYQIKWLQHVQRMETNRLPKQAIQCKPKGRRNIGRQGDRGRDEGTNFILRIKEQETRLTLHEHDDDDGVCILKQDVVQLNSSRTLLDFLRSHFPNTLYTVGSIQYLVFCQLFVTKVDSLHACFSGHYPFSAVFLICMSSREQIKLRNFMYIKYASDKRRQLKGGCVLRGRIQVDAAWCINKNKSFLCVQQTLTL